MRQSKCSEYDSIIEEKIGELGLGLNRTDLTDFIIENCNYKGSHVNLRRYIGNYIKNKYSNDYSNSENNVGYFEDVTKLDSFKEYCNDEGIDIKKVKSAKYVNHQGQQKFNIVLDYDESKGFDLERFKNEIKGFFHEKVTPIRLPKFPSATEISLNLYIADEHIGCDVKGSLYKNEYNRDVFSSRLHQMTNIVKNVHGLYGRIDRIALFFLGDSLDGMDGFTTRGGHKLPQNMTNNEVIRCFFEEHAKLIHSIVDMDVCNNISIRCCADSNHGGDFEYAAYYVLEQYIKSAIPSIDFHIEEDFIGVECYGEHTFMYCHGKDKKEMKHGFPKHLDVKTELYIKDFITERNLKGHCHFVKGDLHVDCKDNCNSFRYRNCTSLFGASKWIHTNFGWTRAGVSYDIVPKHDNNVLEGVYFFTPENDKQHH